MKYLTFILFLLECNCQNENHSVVRTYSIVKYPIILSSKFIFRSHCSFACVIVIFLFTGWIENFRHPRIIYSQRYLILIEYDKINWHFGFVSYDFSSKHFKRKNIISSITFYRQRERSLQTVLLTLRVYVTWHICHKLN